MFQKNYTPDLQLIIKALAFSAHKHRNQRRKDAEASPYINHPIDVVHVLVNEADIFDTHLICAALLHDTLEDTQTTEDEIREIFGDEICAIVLELTDDKALPKLERKHLQIVNASKASYPAKLVKIADKICNLRDIHRTPPVDWSHERRQQYLEWAYSVIDRLRGTHQQLERLFDTV
jgi:guanosine-3',5'-bis(diphosphate) 3'-pyrophosphohydrolase